MITCTFFCLIMLYALCMYSQNVGINTNTPDNSAALDVYSIDKGFLPPRMTSVQRMSIHQPATGLMVYDTDTECPYVFNGVWQNLCNTVPDTTDGQIIDMTYGENINVGDAVVVGDGMSGYLSVEQYVPSGSNITYNDTSWIGQVFVTSFRVKSIKAVRFRNSTPNSPIVISIRETSLGLPIGNDISTVSFNTPTNVSHVATVAFPIPVVVMPNTEYAFVIRSDSANYVYPNNFIVGNSSNPYTQGTVVTSIDSGITWTTIPCSDLWFSVFEVVTEQGMLYKTDPQYLEQEVLSPGVQSYYIPTSSPNSPTSYVGSGDLFDNFIGYALESGTAGETKKVQISGACSVFSGIQPGRIYYMDNTPGSISLTPGTQSRRIGLGIDSTTILIRQP